MSYLSEEMERQMQRCPTKSWVSIAGEMKLSTSQVYKWTSGRQTHISEENLTALAFALGGDQDACAALVCAHLQDECFGPGSELVSISIRRDDQRPAKPIALTKGERALDCLANRSRTDPSVHALLIGLVQLMQSPVGRNSLDSAGGAQI